MKKHFLLVLMSCFNLLLSAQVRHFNMDLDETIADTQIVNHLYDIFSLPSNTTFILTNTTTDNSGIQHRCYEQYVNNIPVHGGQILVHSSLGIVKSINGVVLEGSNGKSLIKNRLSRKSNLCNNDDIVIISSNQCDDLRYAYKLISEELGAYLYIDVETGDTIKTVSFIHTAQTTYATNTIYYGRQELTVESSGKWRFFSTQAPRIETIDATNQDFSAKSTELYNTLISLCNTYYEEDKDSLNSYLTSITLELNDNLWWDDIEEGINKYPDLYIKITNNSGELVYVSNVYESWDWKTGSVTYNPMLLLDGNKYTIKLYDEDVVTDDYGGGFTISSTTKGMGSLSTTNFNVTINVTGNPIRDAHWGMEKTLEFYKNVLGRDSYDGKGATVYQFVNPFEPGVYPNQARAICQSPYCMLFGFGDGISKGPFVSLDMMAHEFSHLVTAHNNSSGLENKGEPGALNEGFSDIFAVLVEGYVFGEYDWTIGEKVVFNIPFIRSFKNPKNGEHSQPTTYGKNPWADPSSNYDDGGVHINSSILAHWFYLLSEGGFGVNDNQDSYKVTGIGIDKATEIVYNTWMNRLTKLSTFADARESFIDEVLQNQKYGKGSPEHIAVVNAWHAVGVGGKYVEEPQDSNLKPGKYVIVANRVEDDKNNWYYMTSDLGTASTKRFQAVSAGNGNIDAIETTKLEDKYIWELEADGSNWKLKNDGQYITWKSGNSANLDATGKSLTFDVADNQVVAHFYDGSAERYLSLHVGNDYFAFYANTGQIEQLYFLPCEEGQQPPVEEPADEFIVLAQRNENSNWFYMTADLGTAGTKRFQAIDAGTPNKALINTSPTDTKYIWSFEEVDGGVALVNGEQYASWKSGNSAILSTTPMALNIIDVSEDQVNMSFVDGEGYTRYLSLNATAGNNYFAFYKGTTQKCNLLIIPYGEKITTDIDVVLSETPIIRKVIRDGQLLIIRDGKTYNAQGILISY